VINKDNYYFGRCPVLCNEDYFRGLKTEGALLSLENYEQFLFSIKEELFEKIMKNDLVQKILIYNNKGVERIQKQRINIKKFPNSKKENSVIKTLTAYIYRSMFKYTYGAFSNFYTKIIVTDYKPKKSSFKITYTIDANTDIKKRIYLNPCHKVVDGKYVFFNIKNDTSSIIAIDDDQYLLLYKIVNDSENIAYSAVKKMFLDVGILREDFNSISAIKSSISRSKTLKNENLKDSKIYNCINKSSFYITPDNLEFMKNAKSLYLRFLEKQLEHFAYEKQCLIEKIKRKTDKANLLEFVLDNLELIDKLYEGRMKFDTYFLEKLGIISEKFSCDVEQISVSHPPEIKKEKQTEAYVSRCNINRQQYAFIDAMSPTGVFSSRINLNFGVVKENNTNFLECMYNHDESAMNFHALKRNNVYSDILNINCYDDINTSNVKKISEVYLEIVDNKIFLRIPDENKFYEPVFHTTVPNNGFIVTKFLKMISSYQEEIYDLPSVEQYFLNDNNYLPRVVCEDLILQKRVWKVSPKDIKIIRNTPMIKFENFAGINEYRKLRNIPRYVSVFREFKDNKRVIDLNNPYSVSQLKIFLNYGKDFFFEELLPSPESISNLNKSNELLTQILI
jgi:hypothetical protein